MRAARWLETPWPWIALFGLACAPLVQDLAVEKFFSADGAAYFQWVLERGGFTDFAWARNHAVFFVQWPVVFALRAGVTDWRILEGLFAAGLLLPHVAGFAVCVAARRGLSKWPLAFPVASLLAITIPADYLLVGEHHVLVGLAWAILFLALRPAALTGWELTVAAGLLVIISRSYESAVVVAPVLAGAFLLRARDAEEPAWARTALVALCLAAAAMAAYSILVPRDPGNRSAFLQSIVAPARRPQVVLGAAFLVPFVLALRRAPGSLAWLAAGLVAVAGIVAFESGSTRPVWAGDSFASRTLSMTLLPPLLVAAAWLTRRDTRVSFTATHFLAFVVFTAVVVAVSVAENRQWIEFRSAFKTVLATRTGVVPIESTPLARHPAGWPWNNAILSYLWSGEHVRAVVLNPSDTTWEPFDPRTSAILEGFRQPPDFLTPRR